MTIITLHHPLFGHCVNSLVIVLDLGIFLRELRSLRKIPQSKTITSDFTHNDLKNDGAQLLLSNEYHFSMRVTPSRVFLIYQGVWPSSTSMYPGPDIFFRTLFFGFKIFFNLKIYQNLLFLKWGCEGNRTLDQWSWVKLPNH